MSRAALYALIATLKGEEGAMAVLRWLTIVIWTLYALMSAMPLAFNIAYKFGYAPPLDMPGMSPAHLALMNATTWLNIALWGACVALYLVTVFGLIRKRSWALTTALGAFVLDFGNWLWFKLGPYYNAAFSPEERQFDYVILAVNIALILGVWVMAARGHLKGGAGA